MRRSLDVLRSVKRYLSQISEFAGYEIRLSSEEGTWQRPFMRVAWSTPATLSAIGAYHLETRRTMNIVAWPVESASADHARADAEDVIESLTLAFSKGLHTSSYSVYRAHPLRIPIWDFAGVAMNAAVNETTARATTDFASVVEPPSIGDMEDPNTEYSRLVVCDLRLRWTRVVAVPDTSPVVADVQVSP